MFEFAEAAKYYEALLQRKNRKYACMYGIVLVGFWTLGLLAGCAVQIKTVSGIPSDAGSPGFEPFSFPLKRIKAMRPIVAVGVPLRPGHTPDVALAMWGDPTSFRGGREQGSLVILRREEQRDITTVRVIEEPAGRSPTSIAVGDFNKDGLVDIAVVSMNSPSKNRGEGPGELIIFLGKGDGTFKDDTWDIPSMHPFPAGIGVADFDRNGYDDIVVGTNANETSRISVFFCGLERGDAGVQQVLHLPTEGIVGRSVAIGDFNGDTRPDIAIAHAGNIQKPATAGITLFLSEGTRRFDRRPFYPMLGQKPMALTAGRFTGSRFSDLAVLSSSDISILASDGQGGLKEVHRIAEIHTEGFNFQSIQAVDFNRDGNEDLVFVERSLSEEPISKVIVLLGDGKGRFNKRLEVANGFSKAFDSPVIFENLHVADLDENDLPDIIVPANTLDFIRAYNTNPTVAGGREDAHGTLWIFFNRLSGPARGNAQ